MLNYDVQQPPAYTELGVFITLSAPIQQQAQKLNQQLAERLPEQSNIQTIYHISLGQGRFKTTDIGKFEQAVQQAVGNFTKFPVHLQPNLVKASGNIFWDAELSETLKALEQSVMQVISQYRDGLMRQYQAEYAQATSKEKQRFDRTGIPNSGDKFRPHITVFYNSGDSARVDQAVQAVKPDKSNLHFTPQSIAMGRLGYHGNVKEVIYTVDLQSSQTLSLSSL